MSGGPWVSPSQSMRHLAYTRADVEGGSRVSLRLKSPQSESWQDYRDLMVLAFPTPEGDTGTHMQVAKATASGDSQKWLDCLNGKLRGSIMLKPTSGQKPYVVDVELVDS